MKELIFRLLFLFSFFVLTVSTQSEVGRVFLKKEVVLDLSGSSKDQQHQVKEWIIETDTNHIFFLSFLTNNNVDEHQIASSLTIVDGNKPDSAILFPSEDGKNILSPFYSTGNVVSIKLIASLSSPLNGFRLKVEKAVPCPFNLGSGSSCGRIVDDLSCYCALYAPTRTWDETRTFCRTNNMSLISIETYEEDLAVFTTFGGSEPLWLGASDTASEGQFIWDSTGKKMVPGYVGWYPGYPQSACGTSTFDCAVYNTYQTLPAWVDDFCSDKLGGICELQPNH